MRMLKISRRGEYRLKQNKATAICVGGHGASNNSQSDMIVSIYEEVRNIYIT